MNPLMKVVVLSFAVLAFGLNVYEREVCGLANYAKLTETSSDFPSIWDEDPTGRRSGSLRRGRKRGQSKSVRPSKVLRKLQRHPKTRKQARYFYENDMSGLGL